MAIRRPTRNWQRLVLLLLLLTAFGLRLHELARQDIWWDEARNIDVALRPFLQIANAPELDIHPPVYFWMLHGWARFFSLEIGSDPGTLPYLVRLLSVFAGVIGVALVYQLSRHAGSASAGLIGATLATVAPIWLAESQETRMYTVGFGLLMAAAIAFLKMLAVERPEGSNRGAVAREEGGQVTRPGGFVSHYRYHIAFVLLSALALLTHYNVVFILVAWYLWWTLWSLVGRDRWRRLSTLLICGSAMTLLVLPIAPIALRQIPTYENPNLVVPSVIDYLSQNWQAYVGGYVSPVTYLGAVGTPWLWLVLILLGTGLVLAWIGGERRNLSFLLAWLGIGLALYYVAVVDRGAFNVRYSSFITPALYALFGIGLASLSSLWRPLTALALVFLLIGLAPAAYADIYDPDNAREDVEGLVEWLQNNAGPDDLILVDQKYPFGFYYPNYVIDTSAPMTDSGKTPARYLFVDINDIDERLNQWATDAEQIFWVQWFESDTDPRRSVPFLLDKEGQRAGEQWFRGYSVDWWTMTPPNHFELAETFAPVDIRWPPAVGAVEVALPTDALRSGDTLFAVVRWQRLEGTVKQPLKARLGLYNEDDQRVAQSDERILNDRHLLPSQWAAGEEALNVYRLQSDADVPPGTYQLRLLVYDADTLEPLGYIDEAGNPAGVEAAIGTIEIR